MSAPRTLCEAPSLPISFEFFRLNACLYVVCLVCLLKCVCRVSSSSNFLLIFPSVVCVSCCTFIVSQSLCVRVCVAFLIYPSLFLLHSFVSVSIVFVVLCLLCALTVVRVSCRPPGRPDLLPLSFPSSSIPLQVGCSLGMGGISRRVAVVVVRSTCCLSRCLLWRCCRLGGLLGLVRGYSIGCCVHDCRSCRVAWGPYDRLHDQLVLNLAQV